MRLRRSKRGQVVIYLTFMIAAIVIVLLAAVFAPMGVRINTEFMTAGSNLLTDSQGRLDAIQDQDVRAALNASLDEAILAGEDNIDIQSDIFQYSWILVVAVTAFVIFLLGRRIVEFGAGGIL